MPDIKLAIGLMSGTSMDGIDASLLRSDGDAAIDIMGHHSYTYSAVFRQQLKSALDIASRIKNRDDRPAQLREIEVALTDLHATLVQQLLHKYAINSDSVDLIGFHGQTVLHRPENALTVQIGDGQQLANQTGIDVIYDMRANDMTHGGQGAPLVPVYHRALANKLRGKAQFPIAFVNIGGISNLTWIGEESSIYAFDCGPGNVLIDQWISLRTSKQYDDGGKIALKGNVIDKIIQNYQMHSFFCQPTPGSLDWRSFSPLTDTTISIEDGAASLSYITAFGIVNSFRHVPQTPKTLVLSGGGAHNKAIAKYLEKLTKTANSKLLNAQSIGADPDFIESDAWGYLAIRSFYGLPLTYPTTTGCDKPVSGGKHVKPNNLQ